MTYFVLVLEWIGTVAFALSGAMTGLKKKMDVFGVCVLGLTTAVGGGVFRDLILGITPPTAFVSPQSALIALAVSAVVFFRYAKAPLGLFRKRFELSLLVADAAGLGIFSVVGVRTAMEAGLGENLFLVLFVGLVTGVGGGVLRDVFAGDRPYIFVKHIYACAALAGALLCRLLWPVAGPNVSMSAGFALVVVIRLCSAYFRWSLPKARGLD